MTTNFLSKYIINSSGVKNITIVVKNQLLFKRILNNTAKPINSADYLGRWGFENEAKTILKIDYANIDHCGVCTMEIIEHSEKDKEKEEFYRPFTIV
jgi:hypothetical protein